MRSLPAKNEFRQLSVGEHIWCTASTSTLDDVLYGRYDGTRYVSLSATSTATDRSRRLDERPNVVFLFGERGLI